MVNKIRKEVSWSFAAKGISFFLYFSFNIFIARILGPEHFGLWSLSFSIITIGLVISYFGINASSRKYIAQYNETDELKRILVDSFILRIGISIIFTLIFFVGLNIVKSYGYDNILISILLYALPLVFLSGIVEYLKDCFVGLHRLKYNFILSASEHGLKLGLIIYFLSSSNEIFRIIDSIGISLLITSIVGMIILYKNFYLPHISQLGKSYKKEILKYSLPLLFINIGILLTTQVDIIMLGALRNEYEVGIYSIAKDIIVKLPHISLAITMGSMQIFAKMNSENKDKLKKMFLKLLKINTVIFTFLGFFIFLGSYLFVPLLYGNDYNESIRVFQVLTPYMIMVSFGMFFLTILDYQGKAKKRAINLSITMLANIILNYYLIQEYGAFGAGIATTLSFIPYFFLNYLEVLKIFK